MNFDTPKKFNFVRHGISDEDFKKLRLDLDPKGFYPAGNPRYWLIDEKHDLKFSSLGGRGDHPESHDLMPNFYLLVVGKLFIRFESRYIVKTTENKNNYLHEIFNAQCPAVLFEHREHLYQAIREALFANWHSRENKRYATTDVDITPFAFNFIQ